MYNFKNDYCYIAHEEILTALIKHQDEAQGVYGLDNHSENAKKLIKEPLLVWLEEAEENQIQNLRIVANKFGFPFLDKKNKDSK